MELEKAAGQVDHSESDCIFIAVLSHGELGILYASDHAYKPDRLWTAFNAEKCPTLAGNTKKNIFLITPKKIYMACTDRKYHFLHSRQTQDVLYPSLSGRPARWWSALEKGSKH